MGLSEKKAELYHTLQRQQLFFFFFKGRKVGKSRKEVRLFLIQKPHHVKQVFGLVSQSSLPSADKQ